MLVGAIVTTASRSPMPQARHRWQARCPFGVRRSHFPWAFSPPTTRTTVLCPSISSLFSDSGVAPILDAIRQQAAVESLIDVSLVEIGRACLGSARPQSGHLARTHNSNMAQVGMSRISRVQTESTIADRNGRLAGIGRILRRPVRFAVDTSRTGHQKHGAKLTFQSRSSLKRRPRRPPLELRLSRYTSAESPHPLPKLHPRRRCCSMSPCWSVCTEG